MARPLVEKALSFFRRLVMRHERIVVAVAVVSHDQFQGLLFGHIASLLSYSPQFKFTCRSLLAVSSWFCIWQTSEPCHASQKYLEGGHILVKVAKCSERPEMVFIAEAFEHFVHLFERRIRLSSCVPADRGDQALVRELVVVLHAFLLVIPPAASYVRLLPRLRVSGWLRASPASRRGCKWHLFLGHSNAP